MLTLILLAGLWSTDCVQTQTQLNTGWVIDSYSISESGNYSYLRTWFKDGACSQEASKEREDGILKLGKEITGDMFAKGAQEVDFKSEGNVNLGAMKIEDNTLKVARSLPGSSTRNTMLAIIGFKKK